MKWKIPNATPYNAEIQTFTMLGDTCYDVLDDEATSLLDDYREDAMRYQEACCRYLLYETTIAG